MTDIEARELRDQIRRLEKLVWDRDRRNQDDLAKIRRSITDEGMHLYWWILAYTALGVFLAVTIACAITSGWVDDLRPPR